MFLASGFIDSKEDVEKYKEADMIERTLSEMAGEFPRFTRVFLHERDLFLAWNIQKAAAKLASTGKKQSAQ